MTIYRSPIFRNGPPEPKRDPEYRVMVRLLELARLLNLGVEVDTDVFAERIAGTANFERGLREIRQAAKEKLQGLEVFRRPQDDGRRWIISFDRDPGDVEDEANAWIDEHLGVRGHTSPQDRARKRAYRRELKRLGLCYDCKKGPLYPGSAYCEEHREESIARSERRKAQLRKQGLCLWCGEEPAEKPHVLCSLCAAIGRERGNQAYKESVEAGICPRCRGPQDRVGSYCSKCLDAARTARETRPEGQCSRCLTRPARPGFKMCDECAQKSSLYKKPVPTRHCECGAPLPFRGKKCKACIDSNRRKSYEEKRDSGLCVICGREPQAIGVLGAICHTKRR